MNTDSKNINLGWSRDDMAQRAAQDIPDGAYVNLGIGIPEKVAKYIPQGVESIYHTENGLLGMGPAPEPEFEDPELINAGKKLVTSVPGAAYFHHADSFAMIRGGHIDICILGAMQISETGDLANWSTGAKDAIPAVGGAMDLVAGVKKIFVITQHCTKQGNPKIMQSCNFPLTGKAVVSRVYTDLAVLDIKPTGMHVTELANDVQPDYLIAKTACKLIFDCL